MLRKGQRLYSIFNNKCPQCHEGEFLISSAYDIKNAGKIHEHCSNCGLKYEKEPGFFYGSMYVSYALQVAIFVTLWTSFNLFFPNLSTGWQLTTILSASILLSPYIYALSKIVWINFFISFKKDVGQKNAVN
jgi:uncharacterized protein (DUF983 family)